MHYINIFLMAVMIMTPAVALADGMVIAPPDRYVWETDQKAVIFHENGRESLVLSITFQGDAENFAWIVPTPSKPEVSKSFDELFLSLDELTRVTPNYDRAIPMGFSGSMKETDQAVTVIESKQIEYYDVVVLESSDSKALVRWLDENGYEYPEAGRYILQSYIDNQWYFTAVKIADNYLSDNVSRQLRGGHAIPLRLDFASEKIVYPLRISSIIDDASLHGVPVPNNNEMGATNEDTDEIPMPVPVPPRAGTREYYYRDDYMGVMIYVIAENKQSLPMFDTLYGGWVNGNKIEELAFDDQGDPWLSPQKDKYFLTKLYRYMSRIEMTNDLYLRNGENNEPINAPQDVERGFAPFVVVIAIGGVFFLILLALLIVQSAKKE